MRITISLVILILCMTGCSKKAPDTYYLIYGEHLRKYETENGINYHYTWEFYLDEYHGKVHNTYELRYLKASDSSFIKPVSFLDSNDILGAEIFSPKIRNKHPLFQFPGSSSPIDSFKIFVGEMTLDGDSVIFREVRRSIIGYL